MGTTCSLYFAFVLLQLLDIYTTHRVLSQGGREVNPLVRWLMDAIGVVPALLIAKAAAVVAVAAAIHQSDGAPLQAALALLCAFYGFVVVRNWRQII